MKKAILYMLVLIGVCSSCRKEYSLEGGTVQTANFTAQIDGVHWQSATTTEQATMIQGLINITGISTDNQEISMTLSGTGTGTYYLSQRSASLATYANIDSSFVYAYTTNEAPDTAQAGGQVTITEIDQTNQTISGIFYFNAYRVVDGLQKRISQGVFTRLPYSTSLPTTTNLDTLTATIDAKAWVGKSIQAAVNGGELTIVGSSADGTQSVGLLMPSNTTAGTYPLDGTNPSYLGVYTVLANANTTGLVSVSGQVTVTQNNTTTSRISGTFSFSASDPSNPSTVHYVTSGVFSVYYGP
jgi:hypothetical protein